MTLELHKDVVDSAERCTRAASSLKAALVKLGASITHLMEPNGEGRQGQSRLSQLPFYDDGFPEDLLRSFPDMVTGLLGAAVSLKGNHGRAPDAEFPGRTRDEVLAAAREARLAVEDVRQRIIPDLQDEYETSRATRLKEILESLDRALHREHSQRLKVHNSIVPMATIFEPGHTLEAREELAARSDVAMLWSSFSAAIFVVPSIVAALRRAARFLRRTRAPLGSSQRYAGRFPANLRQLPWDDGRITDLRDTLVSAYSSRDTAEHVVRTASVSLGRVPSGAAIEPFWNSVLDEAARQGKVGHLLKAVLRDQHVSAYHQDIEILLQDGLGGDSSSRDSGGNNDGA